MNLSVISCRSLVCSFAVHMLPPIVLSASIETSQLICDLWTVRMSSTMMLPILSALILLIRSINCNPLKVDDVLASINKTTAIQCAIDNPKNNPIIWKHWERVLFVGNIRVRHDNRISVKEDNLVIKNVKSTDKGLYSCEVEDSAGILMRKGNNLIVLEPPVARISQGRQLTVKTGTSLALTCIGTGIPLPEVRWIKN